MRQLTIVAVTATALLPSIASAQFNNIYLPDATTGRVGFHMSIGYFSVLESDLPKGNTGRPLSGSCQLGWWDPAFSGELPPGVQFVAGQGSDAMFAGTPRQPGTWRGTFSFDVGCTGGPDTNRYHRSIPINFSIEP